jgi:dextranase
MADVYPYVINETARLVDELRGEDGAVYFNAVGNDPVETVAPSNQDGVYIEVWSPYNYFMDLPRIINNAQTLGGNKPVIIAAYISPENRHNVLLADALILGSGAYHLELGEPDAMLADPYFPKYGTMDADLSASIARYYDFAVRYENALALDTVDASEARASALTIDGVLTESRRSRDRVGVLVRAGQAHETFSLVNLMGITSPRWNQQADAPTPLRDLAVTLNVERPVKRLWWASPDTGDLSAHAVEFTVSGETMTFRLPSLEYWTVLVVEYEAAR